MSSTILLEKLIDIEKSIGVEPESLIRHKVLEAQEYLLRTQGFFSTGLRGPGDEEHPQREALLRAFSLRREPS